MHDSTVVLPITNSRSVSAGAVPAGISPSQMLLSRRAVSVDGDSGGTRGSGFHASIDVDAAAFRSDWVAGDGLRVHNSGISWPGTWRMVFRSRHGAGLPKLPGNGRTRRPRGPRSKLPAVRPVPDRQLQSALRSCASQLPHLYNSGRPVISSAERATSRLSVPVLYPAWTN